MKKVHRAVSAVLFAALAIVLVSPPVFAEDFPLRPKYPDSVPVATEDLAKIFDKAIIVDARNKAEYDVIRIKGATNLLVGKMTKDSLSALRSPSGDTPIVFYCNGVTCSKSYKASTQAVEWGFENVLCYDAGVFTWATAHPDKAEFFGKLLTAEELESAIIPKEKLAAVMLEPGEFTKKGESGSYTIFDIRDPNERSEAKFSMPKTRSMSFDNMVKIISEKKAAVPRSGVLVVDNVGKQVRWLQYYFEEHGISDYYFLKGGVRAWKEAGLQ